MEGGLVAYPPLVDPPMNIEPEWALAAADMVRTECGWHIAPSVTETIVLDGKGDRILFLPSLHVTAITSIKVEGVTLAASAYEWSQTGIVERVYGWWPRKLRSIEVTLTHGLPSCPLKVREYIRQMAESGPPTSPLTKAQVGQVTVTYASPTPDQSLLAPYRRLGVA